MLIVLLLLGLAIVLLLYAVSILSDLVLFERRCKRARKLKGPALIAYAKRLGVYVDDLEKAYDPQKNGERFGIDYGKRD